MVGVVYRPFPTSNHNTMFTYPWYITLYIVRFLHQTTTLDKLNKEIFGCISSVSYIKPQQYPNLSRYEIRCISSVSYIKPQHLRLRRYESESCISSVSYIKPQHTHKHRPTCNSCISSVSYIKPQPIISNKLYTNILLILFIIKNGRVGFVYRKNTKKTPTEQVR